MAIDTKSLMKNKNIVALGLGFAIVLLLILSVPAAAFSVSNLVTSLLPGGAPTSYVQDGVPFVVTVNMTKLANEVSQNVTIQVSPLSGLATNYTNTTCMGASNWGNGSLGDSYGYGYGYGYGSPAPFDCEFTVTLPAEGNYSFAVFVNDFPVNATAGWILAESTAPTTMGPSWLDEPDMYVSSNLANNQITISVNATDTGAVQSGISYVTVNFSSLDANLNATEDRMKNMTFVGGTTWTTNVQIFNVTEDNFVSKDITLIVYDNSGNPSDVSTLPGGILLYNQTTPFDDPFGCMQWDTPTTDLSAETDLSDVNFVMAPLINMSCFYGMTPYGAPSWFSSFERMALINFSSVDFSNPATGPKLASMYPTNMEINVTSPNSFGASRIYFNTVFFAELNTPTEITVYHLPFTSIPVVTDDAGAAGSNQSTIAWAQNLNEAEGNLTFSVYGFSGYNMTDDAAPTITLNAPSGGSVIYDVNTLINVSVNGTGTQLSVVNLLLNGDLYVYNATNTTISNLSCVNVTAGSELFDCVLDATPLPYAPYTLNVTAYDFGGMAGNSVNSVSTFTVYNDITSPVVTLLAPADGAFLNMSNVSLAFNVTDDSATMVDCMLWWNSSVGGIGNQTLSGWPTNTSSESAGALDDSEGITFWYINCTDGASNTGTSSMYNFTRDFIMPNVTAINATTSGAVVTLNVTTDEIATCRYSTSDVNYSSMTVMSSTNSTSHSKAITFGSTSSGTYYVRCADRADNQMNVSNSTNYSVTVAASSTTCTPLWSCTSFGTCSAAGVQTRTCSDIRNCGATADKPAETQTCIYTPCVESWTCGAWGNCSSGGYQSRLCSDAHSCGTSASRPTELQSCTVAAEPTLTVAIIEASSTENGGSAALIPDVPAGDKVEIDMPLATTIATGISSVTLFANNELANVNLTVNPISKPADLPAPNGTALNYMEIKAGNVTSGDLTKATIKFEVKKANVKNVANIKLARYVNGAWVNLPTVFTGETADSYLFEAETPGFSYFAIVELAPTPTTEVTTNVTTGGENQTLISPPPTQAKGDITWMFIVAILVVIGAGFWWYSQQKPWGRK